MSFGKRGGLGVEVCAAASSQGFVGVGFLLPVQSTPRYTVALSSALVLVGCVLSAPTLADVVPLPAWPAEAREGARVALDSIRLEDGMSEREAQIIANVYFVTHVSGCGGAYDPRKQGGRWVFKLLVGAAGGYTGDLEIGASTGSIVDHGQVVFRTFADFRADAVDHVGRRYWYARLRHVF